MSRHGIHAYVETGGFNRIKHTKAMMEQRIRLTEEFGEHSGNYSFPSGPAVSSFTLEAQGNPSVIESLRREVAPFTGSIAVQTCNQRVVVPYDGTEDAETIERTRPDHPPTSQLRASLPA